MIDISSTYTWGQFIPAFSLVGLAAVILMADAFLPKLPKRLYGVLAAIGTFIVAFSLSKTETGFGVGFGSLAAIATCLSILLAMDYTKVCRDSLSGTDSEDGTAEFYALPLVACAGILCLTQARDLIMLFVSLEIITLTSYVLAGYFRRNQGSIEAGIKYLVIGAMSTGMLVFGAAWYFGMSGSFVLSATTTAAALNSGAAIGAGFLMAIALLFTGAFFKVGAVPMQVWVPDVYQGAPTPVSNFLATASKTAGFVLMGILMLPISAIISNGSELSCTLLCAFAVVIAATLLVGNLGAIVQTNAKRLLGYSSIGQAGFILAFYLVLSDGPVTLAGINANVVLYLLAYTLATTTAFFAIAMVRTQRGSEELSAFRGLGKTNPRTAFLITVAFASLAGVPLTYGFMVKFYAFTSVIYVLGGNPWLVWLLPIMLICAAAGFYYYFKVIREMYWVKPADTDKPLCVPAITAIVMTVCTIAILVLGTMPLLFAA